MCKRLFDLDIRSLSYWSLSHLVKRKVVDIASMGNG